MASKEIKDLRFSDVAIGPCPPERAKLRTPAHIRRPQSRQTHEHCNPAGFDGAQKKETTLKYIHLARTNLRKEMVETAL
jgi:hypothetical protein